MGNNWIGPWAILNPKALPLIDTYRYDKNKTMSLGCDTGFACVSLLEPGPPCKRRKTQDHSVSQPSDTVLL